MFKCKHNINAKGPSHFQVHFRSPPHRKICRYGILNTPHFLSSLNKHVAEWSSSRFCVTQRRGRMSDCGPTAPVTSDVSSENTRVHFGNILTGTVLRKILTTLPIRKTTTTDDREPYVRSYLKSIRIKSSYSRNKSYVKSDHVPGSI
jgi:hypothetical protein